MADYNRYSVEPEDIPRRKRERRKKQAKSRSRVWLAVKLFVVVVLLALIAGLAVAAGAIYALSRDLPSLDSLQRNPLAVNTTIYDRTGKVLIAELHGGQNRVLLSRNQIPDVMKEATVAVEDARFYEHHGVDYLGVARAMLENLRAGSVVQGGSTITEQYIKNAYIGDERTYTRKIREAVLAWQLEDRWSKDQILTAYLNTVYYGAGAYGVEAAARTYFHKHASALSLKEAAHARGAAQVPLGLLADDRQGHGHAAAQQGAAAHGRPEVHHAGARRHAHGQQAPRLPAPAELRQEPRRLLRLLRDQAAHRALRLGDGLRRRSQGHHQHRCRLAAGGDRHHQVDHGAAGLRVQAFRGAGRHRPRERLHPHHGRRPGLQEAAVQPRVPGQAPGGVLDEALRAGDGSRAGHEPGHDLLHVHEPHGSYLVGAYAAAVDRQRRRPGRPRERRRPPPPSPTTSCSRSSASTSARRTR